MDRKVIPRYNTYYCGVCLKEIQSENAAPHLRAFGYGLCSPECEKRAIAEDSERVDNIRVAIRKAQDSGIETPAGTRGLKMDLDLLARELATKLKPDLPDGIGMTLLVFNYEKEGRLAYISTAEREEMRESMRQLIDHWDKQEYGSVNIVKRRWGDGKIN